MSDALAQPENADTEAAALETACWRCRIRSMRPAFAALTDASDAQMADLEAFRALIAEGNTSK